ncbi:MAG: hypothetical protein KC502_15075 [Myxococcales bacterium]|nr:hypothetical protein [Myxococcales bacterium]
MKMLQFQANLPSPRKLRGGRLKGWLLGGLGGMALMMGGCDTRPESTDSEVRTEETSLSDGAGDTASGHSSPDAADAANTDAPLSDAGLAAETQDHDAAGPDAAGPDAAGPDAAGPDANAPSPDAAANHAVLVAGAKDDGTGFVTFSDVPAPILPGWQGLQHLWVSFRLPAATVPTKPTPIAVTLSVDGQPQPLAPGPTQANLQLVLDAKKPGFMGYDGVAAVVQCPCEVTQSVLRVTVKAKVTGQTLSGSATTKISWNGVCSDTPKPGCGP